MPSERSRDPKTGYLTPGHCELYIPGHSVHWIQAKHSFGEPHRDGRLTDAEDNVITVDFGDEVKRYRNCDPERLWEILGIGHSVRVCEGYSILRAWNNYVFCIVDADEPWVPCDYSPLTSATPEALVKRMETHGGFFVSGQQVLKALADDQANGDESPN
jgi:hypothetical protein